MFDWIRMMFGKRTVHSKISDHQTQQLIERLFAAYQDNKDTSDVMKMHVKYNVRKMLLKDFEDRSSKEGGGGSSSSPISSS